MYLKLPGYFQATHYSEFHYLLKKTPDFPFLTWSNGVISTGELRISIQIASFSWSLTSCDLYLFLVLKNVSQVTKEKIQRQKYQGGEMFEINEPVVPASVLSCFLNFEWHDTADPREKCI